MKNKKKLLLAASIIALCGAAASSAQAAELWSQEGEQVIDSASNMRLKISTGFDYSTGDYGSTSDTEIWYVPVTGKLSMGNWSAKLTVPWIRIKGPGVVVGDGDSDGGAAGAVTTESGLGDVVGSLTYTVDMPEKTYLDLTAKVKYPTADEKKGLGTGQFDYTAMAEVTKDFADNYVFVGGGYKFVGDNRSLNLDNVWLASFGGGHDFSRDTSAGFAYDWRQSASGGDDPSEASVYLKHNLTKRTNVQVYGVMGFSDASPDYGTGVVLGYKY